MKTFKDLEFTEMVNDYGVNGKRARMMFDNGYGVSVVQSDMTYGGREGLYELGVLDDPKGGVVSYTSVTMDVLGWLTEDDVTTHMAEVQALRNIFMTKHQIKQLKEKDWDVIKSGAYISLCREDFKKDHVYEEMCRILSVSTYSNHFTVLAIATKKENKEED
jgi:hypothetical protein